MFFLCTVYYKISFAIKIQTIIKKKLNRIYAFFNVRIFHNNSVSKEDNKDNNRF